MLRDQAAVPVAFLTPQALRLASARLLLKRRLCLSHLLAELRSKLGDNSSSSADPPSQRVRTNSARLYWLFSPLSEADPERRMVSTCNLAVFMRPTLPTYEHTHAQMPFQHPLARPA